MSQLDLQWFAEGDEEKTEDPSEHRLQKAREEGRVAKSQELNSSVVLLLCVVLLIILAPWMLRKFEESVKFFIQAAVEKNLNDRTIVYASFRYFVMLTLPFAAIGLVGALFANIIQNRGFIFSTKPIEPNFEKLIPKVGEYFKNTLFSFQGVFNVVKSLVKVAVIGLITYLFIRSDMPSLLLLIQTDGPELAIKQIGSMAAQILIVCAVFLLAVSVVDYVVQRYSFIKNMKMTKQEVKEEYKEMEGDPEVKSHLESAQRSMLQTNIPRAVKEADVVITNPTHFAVALQWKQETSDSPQVTAKGEDLTAQNMKRIARENDVPLIENRPLARGLYTDTKVGDIIPETYMRAIATVYVQIGYLDKKNKKV